MTISQSKALYKKLKVDERFREKLLAAGTMDDCMEMVSASGFDCSKDEIRTVVEVFALQRNAESTDRFSLWGNRIIG
ncbi:MAG: Nif11-like leader peptide family natural product precursor [Chlorobiaceae bacterium]|nr:Nif11-like leader peptide family natural product precursor [Chlorobiaceae bacterium]NTV60500.1 Nif11-like leader peptide family natural product precursor [Chlorobiaceae bacterium]